MRHLLKSLVVARLSAHQMRFGGLPESTSVTSGTSAAAPQRHRQILATLLVPPQVHPHQLQRNQLPHRKQRFGFIAIEDDPLIVDASAIMDEDGMGSVQAIADFPTAAWMNLTGAVQQSFTPREVHVASNSRSDLICRRARQFETLLAGNACAKRK